MSLPARLKDKVAIVTGAGSGIGRACAFALAREGARVVLVGRRRERVLEAAAEIGTNALAVPADLLRQEDIDRVISQTVLNFGGIHVLINNAGVLHIGNAEQTSEDQWDHIFDVNVRAVWLMSRSVLPEMRKAGGGSIVNMASTLGLVGA